MSTPIRFEDIRDGDRIRMLTAYTAGQCGTTVAYELIERPVQLPTEPGFYMTASSFPDVFQLHEGDWFCGDEKVSPARVRHDGGNEMILLRPVAEVAAEVLADIRVVSRGDGGYFDYQFTAEQLWAIGSKYGVTA